jgi:hypothetical protein
MSKEIVKSEKPQTVLAQLRAAESAVGQALETMARLLSTNITPGQAARAYQLIDKEWKKPIEALREGARQAMMGYADENGALTKPGNPSKTATVEYGGTKYKVERRVNQASKPNEEALKQLLASKNVSPMVVYDQVVSEELNMEKVKALIVKGIITQAELDAIRPFGSPALYVEKL